MNSCSIRRWAQKWTKKLFFHLLDPNILKSFIILTSCDSKWLHWLFRLTMIRDLKQKVERVCQTNNKRHNKHWTSLGGIWCVLLKAKKKEWNLSSQNATWGCLLAHALQCITPNCISEDQWTQYEKKRAPLQLLKFFSSICLIK